MKHVFGKDVRRMSDQIPFCRKRQHIIGDEERVCCCALSDAFRIGCPVLQVSLPEVYDKTAEIDSSQFCSFCLKIKDWVRPSMTERIWADQQTLDRLLSCMSACKTFFIV